ncbi:hypothetical protein K8352_05380 [Flavobacteriaceae bacterium F89]|uniref:Lipoprotein n=1 Tax=Cerina litoralis TaxID=2874477 RepID=A0AAE3JMR1_9FLAO|nr:hypothetical protein [Cerina litoralis]MCG2460170.1 hypothetical protein [Cerina litoralis]
MLSKLVFPIWKQPLVIRERNGIQDFFPQMMMSLVLALGSWLYLQRLYFCIGPILPKKSFFWPVLTKLSVLLLMLACGSYPKENNFNETEITTNGILNPYFSDPSKDYIYKARISLQKKEFGGLFIVKKLGPDRHRVVFTTEMGSKILDFSFERDKFTVNYLLDEMDRKVLINTLKNDFRTLITGNPQVLRTFTKDDQKIFETKNDKKKYFYFYKDGLLNKIIRASGKKDKTEFLFLEARGNMSKIIRITHQNIPLRINLKTIK